MLNPYLFYNGNCEAAFKFYEKTLGGKIETVMRASRKHRPTCRRSRAGRKRSCTPGCR